MFPLAVVVGLISPGWGWEPGSPSLGFGVLEVAPKLLPGDASWTCEHFRKG